MKKFLTTEEKEFCDYTRRVQLVLGDWKDEEYKSKILKEYHNEIVSIFNRTEEIREELAKAGIVYGKEDPFYEDAKKAGWKIEE